MGGRAPIGEAFDWGELQAAHEALIVERDAALTELQGYADLLRERDAALRRAEAAGARLAEAERLLRFLRPAVEAAARRECDQVEGCTYGRCGDLAAVDGFLAAAPAAPPPDHRSEAESWAATFFTAGPLRDAARAGIGAGAGDLDAAERCGLAARRAEAELDRLAPAGGNCPVPGTITHWQESPPEPETGGDRG